VSLLLLNIAVLTQQVAALIREMQQHLSDGRRGEIVRNGVRVAIAGVH
jgi:tRNA U34 5-carboxymethylaminomethyl modifying GTPase MnmE/TrmE